jgi:hypothetical protein
MGQVSVEPFRTFEEETIVLLPRREAEAPRGDEQVIVELQELPA